MSVLREVLTVRDVALELRCSVAHVYNVINGKVKNVSKLPAIPMGRRKLIQRDSLEEWKKTNEQGEDDSMITSSKINTVGRSEEDLYALNGMRTETLRSSRESGLFKVGKTVIGVVGPWALSGRYQDGSQH
jgi:hypothetical protein